MIKLLLFGCLAFLSGCATEEYKALPSMPSPAGPAHSAMKPGIYHTVKRGQTLWQIAQMYGVNIQDIIDSNSIPNGTALEVGQLLFIPGATQVRTAAEHAVDHDKNAFIWPLKGKVIAYFDDPISGGIISHGIDIQAAPGDTVKAAREGDVVLADNITGYGKTVMIDHQDGFISVYAHNAQLLVKLGQHVYKGDAIAQVGQIGSRSFEHFEIRRGSQATNPLYYLP